MRIIALLLLTFGCSAFGASYYVDPNATGTGDGSSWANAWTSFSAINWGPIGGGSTLFISGGASSQTYSTALTIQSSGTSGNQLNIRVGQDAGHNGVVIFNGVGILSSQSYVTIDGECQKSSHWAITNMVDQSNRFNDHAIEANGSTLFGVHVRYMSILHCNNGIDWGISHQFEVDHCTFSRMLGDRAIYNPQPGSSYGNEGTYHDNYFSFNGDFNTTGGGPDGIQGGGGCLIFSNKFEVVRNASDLNASGQHPDWLQLSGNYIEVFDNEFIDDSGSMIDYDHVYTGASHDVAIFNNIFRYTTNNLDVFPSPIRVYNSGGQAYTVANWNIFNNTFIDAPHSVQNYSRVVGFYTFNGAQITSATTMQIKNNIFMNCYLPGSGNGVTMYPGSYALTDWGFGGNVYYNGVGDPIVINFNGTDYPIATWLSGSETTGTNALPTFVKYTFGNSGADDLHLSSTDTTARGRGINLSSLSSLLGSAVTNDRVSVSRPGTGPWDAGAYQFAVGPTNPIILVTPNPEFSGYVLTNVAVTNTLVIQNIGGGTLNGSIQLILSPYFSLVSSSTYSLTNGQTQNALIKFLPLTVGQFVGQANFNGPSAAVAVQMTGIGMEAHPPGEIWLATNGQILNPFSLSTTGAIFSATEIDNPAQSGQAMYWVEIPTTANYEVNGYILSPSDANNSCYITFDTPNVEPSTVWDMNTNTVFKWNMAENRGNGTSSTDQFNPKIWNLTAGPHQLLIGGREGGVYLGAWQVLTVPNYTPNGLRMVRVTYP